jgi:hypothetical protein
MHEHDIDQIGVGSLRPKGARLEEPESDRRMRAALSGRLDASGPAGVLGLQRAAGNSTAAAAVTAQEEQETSPVHDVVRSAGEPLSPDLRTDMESRLGHDFGDVRVHTDGPAEASARAVNAHAYTVGSHIAFQRSAYDPSSDSGRTTLAHELTHVVQQRNGPVDGAEAPGGIRVSDPSDRFEREAAATATQAVSAPASVSPAPASIQREEAAGEEKEDEAPVQGSFVQREEEAPEEEAAGG